MRHLRPWLTCCLLLGVVVSVFTLLAEGQMLRMAFRFDEAKGTSGFSVEGPEGESFSLRLSTDFTHWESVWADTLSAEGTWCPDYFAFVGPVRFYQAAIEPSPLSLGTLERSEALPFALIRLPVEGLDAQADTTLRVFGADGYVTVASIVELNAADVVFSVPFGPPEWGEGPMPVDIQLVQRKDGQVRISPTISGFRVLPPPILSVPVGTVTLAWLKATEEAAYGNLDAVIGTGYDTPEVLEALAAEIAAAESLLEHIPALQGNPNGKVSLGSVNGRAVWLTHTDLAWTDRLLICLLHSIGNDTTLVAPATASLSIRKLSAGQDCMRSSARNAVRYGTGESNAELLGRAVSEVVIYPRESVLCKASFSMRQGTAVVLGAGAVATGAFLLGLGALASSALALPSAAMLSLSLQMSAGQIALGGALNQDTVAGREMIQDGVNRLDDLAWEPLKPSLPPRVEGALQMLFGFDALFQAFADAEPIVPRRNCDDCLPLYERLSAGCSDLPDLIDQSNCLNAALDAWMDCLETCEWDW